MRADTLERRSENVSASQPKDEEKQDNTLKLTYASKEQFTLTRLIKGTQNLKTEDVR